MLVYLITNLVNGKKYVGQTIQSLSDRWIQHKSRKRKGSHLYKAILKYGHSNFSIESLITVHSKEDADFYEKFGIKEFNLRNPDKGYNLTDGGEGTLGRVLSPEHIEAIRSFQTGRKKPNKLKGVPRTEETRDRISSSSKGKTFSEEHRRNLSLARRRRGIK